MASFPTGIKVFTAVVDGITDMVASLWNVAYDEITAIETWLFGNSIQDAIVKGFELIYNSTTAVNVNAGLLYNGSTQVLKTVITTLTLTTAANWYDGATHSYAGGAGWCYVGVDNAGNIKLLGANPPNKADTAGNTVGTLLYTYINSTYYRVIGAVWVYTNNTITTNGTTPARWYQQGIDVAWDIPIILTTSLSSGSWSSAISCAAGMPSISNFVRLQAYTAHGAGTANQSLAIRPNGSTGTTSDNMIGGYVQELHGAISCFTDSSQQIQHQELGATTISINLLGYRLNIR